MFLSILCKKRLCLENWLGKMELRVWAGGLGVWGYCVLWQCSLWHSQLWHPSVLDAVPLVQPPSHPNSMLSLNLHSSVALTGAFWWHCILLSQQDVHCQCWAHGWRDVFHPAGKGGCRQAWQAFLALLQALRGKEPLFKNVTRWQCGSLNAFSGGRDTQQPVMLQSKVREHTVHFLFSKEAGRSHCSQQYNGWIWTRMEFSHLCMITNLVKHCKIFPVNCCSVQACFLGRNDVDIRNVSPSGSVKKLCWL